MALNITDHVRFVILTPVLALFKVCKKFEGYSNQKAYDTNFASGTGYERLHVTQVDRNVGIRRSHTTYSLSALNTDVKTLPSTKLRTEFGIYH